jgi:glycosyltransferase involved in cell wall biosynthesis
VSFPAGNGINPANMKISAVIPAFNEAKLLGATLRSIQAAGAAFGERGWTMEIVVCDNNSTDATAELARAAGARVVFEPVNQIARARNTGAAAADGDWLIFVDADSQPTRELFADVAAAIESGRCLAGGSTVRMDRRSRAGDAGTGLWNFISRTMKWAAGSFIFCQADAFRLAGKFNLELFASEEIDLSRRLKKLARRVGKKVIILHHHPLLTSARKLSLYSRREYLRFLTKVIFHPRKTTASRESCQPWYDGRR